MSASPPATKSDLHRAIGGPERRGRADDKWRSLPAIVGIISAIAGIGGYVAQLADRMDDKMRAAVAAHDRDVRAHAEQLGSVRDAWRECMQLRERVGALERAASEQLLAGQRRRR